MRIIVAALTLLTLPQTTFAECATPQDTFLSCTFSQGRKVVDVCVDGDNLTYSFGRVGKAPDLVMSVPVVDADYTPWPGIGRSIWESVAFQNQDARYEVSYVIDRIFPEDETEDIQLEYYGYIEVIVGNESQIALSCDDGSVVSGGDSLYDTKTAAGQCWDAEGMDPEGWRWMACK